MHKQKRILARQRPEIVVATPGKLWDLMQDDVDHLSDLTSVRWGLAFKKKLFKKKKFVLKSFEAYAKKIFPSILFEGRGGSADR